LKRLLALLVLLGLLGAAYYHDRLPWLSQEQWGVLGDTLGDARTRAAVKTALHLNRSLEPWPIDVSVATGQVTLRGRVPSEAARAEAGRLAAAVPDVRGVQNLLGIDSALVPPAGGGRSIGESLDDQALAVQVRLALSLNAGLSGTDLQVSAFRREVTLTGEVANATQHRTALDIAHTTTGVAAVVDRLRLRGGETAAAPAPDRLSAARQALADNSNLSSYHLRIEANGETLLLSGRVGAGAERDLAGLLASQTWGGPIENRIQIEPRRDKMEKRNKEGRSR